MMSSILLFHESVYFIYQFISEATLRLSATSRSIFVHLPADKGILFKGCPPCVPVPGNRSLLVKYLINCLYQFRQIYNCLAV